MRMLIKNANILPVQNDVSELLHGCIGIENDKISFIGSCPDFFKPDRIIDAEDGIVLPGLVNAHTHLAMSLFRHYADDLSFWDWLFGRIVPAEEKLDATHVYNGSMLSLVEMIKSGTTCLSDMYFYMDDVAMALEKSGLRARLSRGLSFTSDKDLYKLDETRAFYEKWNGKASGRIMVDVAPHAIYTCGPEYLKKTADLAKSLNTRIHMHLSESIKELEDCYKLYGKSPVAHARDLGLFEASCYAAHCVHLSNEDIEILKNHSVSVVHNPASNLKLANGIAPVKELLDAGINLALGTDGAASNNNLDMFEEINLAALLAKGKSKEPKTLSAYQALQMATIKGAKALGIDNITGSLEPGKKADLIIVDTTAPHFYPRNSASASLVYGAGGADVKTLVCNGQLLMENRQLLLLDENEIYAKAEESCMKLVGSSGFGP